jgi:prepilin-type processing-associated H-X9-DG protein
MSNLRQMGTGWTMYLTENKGRLPEYVQNTPLTPETSWRGYWLGILDTYNVRGATVLCPAADRVITFNQFKGFGNVGYAWSGKWQSNGSPIRFNATTFRESSYGYNYYLTTSYSFGADSLASHITSVRSLSNVPVLLDSVWADFRPENGSEMFPVEPPPNLRGSFPSGSVPPEHWRFLIARHGRAVNAFMADGSARLVPLEETYLLKWMTQWKPYRLSLPLY